MKIYLDDERQAPEGWRLVTTAGEAVAYLKTGRITEISLDHDLGGETTGYDVLTWLEWQVHMNNFSPPIIHIHTANSSARIKMEAAVKSIERFANESKRM